MVNKWQGAWKTQYLTSLSQRNVPQKSRSKINIVAKEGDVESIDLEKLRDTWPLGRIVECYPDQSGTIRTVKLRPKTVLLSEQLTDYILWSLDGNLKSCLLYLKNQLTKSEKGHLVELLKYLEQIGRTN